MGDVGLFRHLGAAFFVVALLTTTAFALDQTATSATGATSGGDLAKSLAPLMGVALAIERFWESMFGLYESSARAAASAVKAAGTAVNWAADELNNARDAMKQAVDALKANPNDDAARVRFEAAERRLLDAEVRISEAVKSPRYVAIKRGVTLLGGLIMGVVAAVSADLTIFAKAGIPIGGGWIDAVLTGLVIGAGSGPLHSFIGMLQELKNAFAGVADLTRGTGIAKASEGLRTAVAAARETGGAVREAAAVGAPSYLAGPPLSTQRLLVATLRPR